MMASAPQVLLEWIGKLQTFEKNDTETSKSSTTKLLLSTMRIKAFQIFVPVIIKFTAVVRTDKDLARYETFLKKGGTPEQFDANEAGSQGLTSDNTKKVGWLIVAFRNRDSIKKKKAISRHKHRPTQHHSGWNGNGWHPYSRPQRTPGTSRHYQSHQHRNDSFSLPFANVHRADSLRGNDGDPFDATGLYLDTDSVCANELNQSLYSNLIRFAKYRLSMGSLHRHGFHFAAGKKWMFAARQVLSVRDNLL